MSKSDYLNLALSIGMDVKAAMLTEISVVSDICETRANMRKELRKKHA